MKRVMRGLWGASLLAVMALFGCSSDEGPVQGDDPALADMGVGDVRLEPAWRDMDAPGPGMRDMGGGDDRDMMMSVDPQPNEGWIGGSCQGESDCEHVEGAVCLRPAQGWPGGTCSTSCDRFCPDLEGANSVTFCVTLDGVGRCLSRCDYDLYPGSGCREDYRCEISPRHNEPGVERGVCVPDDGQGGMMGTTACLQALDALGVVWAPWDYTPRSPDGRDDLVCSVEDPILVEPLINGITYRYYSASTTRTMTMSCDLARALHRLGGVLQEFDIVEVLDLGVFNCRTIANSDRLSEHSHGRAIDIYGLIDAAGQDYILERDWEHDTTTPSSTRARLLYDVAQRMHTDKIFHNVLTPNYNSAHENHFHVDLAPGADFIGLHQAPGYWIGDDRDICGWDHGL